MQQPKEKYSLWTAIAMILGIVIGSGIFFKGDNILVYTEGNILYGVLVFVIGAIAIIFGGLSIGELAARTNLPGGLVTYANTFIGHRIGCIFGWFQIFIYFPTLVAVVSWVVGIYMSILFGWKTTLEGQILIGFGFFTFTFLLNTFSARLGGYFQTTATVIKLIPLFLIAVLGLIFGDPAMAIPKEAVESVQSFSWLMAIGPIAFSYDGWIVSTSISHEIKNAKVNLPRALTIAPIFVLITYVLYFVGISVLVGPDRVVEMGDAHVYYAAEQIAGYWGAKAILIFIIVSVMGTVNGLVLGYIRLPYSLALLQMFPYAEIVQKIHPKYETPVYAALIAFVISVIWTIIHYITQKFNLLPNSDVSEISVAITYVLLAVLYIKVIQMYKRKEIIGKIRGIFNPIMAILGSGIVLLGGMQNPLFVYYAFFCILVMTGAVIYYQRTIQNQK